MNTKLTPPPITPGPWKKVTLNTSKVSLEIGIGSDEAEHNATMALAAPQMAEALRAVWDHFASIDDLSPAEERLFGKSEKVLQEAGYTLTKSTNR